MNPTQIKHESAIGHVTGRAIYADELRPEHGMVSLWPVAATLAHARIVGIDARAALALEGVLMVLTARDIPGVNDTGTILHDEPLIPSDEVRFHGQAVAFVVAEDEALARRAAALVKVELAALTPCITMKEAIAQERFHLPPAKVECGDVDTALAAAPHRLHGEFHLGGQEHFYLETQSARAVIDSEGVVQVVSSTQHPSETQHIVAHVLGVPNNQVVCKSLRMGGGFGGKETQANPVAAIVALAAKLTGRPARWKLERGCDMRMTGKRHAFFAQYEVGFDEAGNLLALKAQLYADGGWSCDLSPPVLMRAMVHIDNAYFIPNVRITGRICKTNVASNTAFRGFGGPQGMVIGEDIIDRIARHLALPVHDVRERNFYRANETPDRNTTPYGQPVVDNYLPQLWQQAIHISDFHARRQIIAAFNAQHENMKRGLAILPVKFGISFNKTEYNQAGALVHLYTDGSIQVSHGGTEMGQGLHTKMLGVAARALGVAVSRLRIMPTSTDKVPNSSATAASAGADLNGQAIKAACETLRARLAPVAAGLLQGTVEDVVFAGDHACLRSHPQARIGFTEVVKAAYVQRISLSATGFYKTPGLSWDAAKGKGHPFYYFAFGTAACEVEVCGFTGMAKLLRVDILHDVGDSLNEVIDRGQIEGGFVQGMGWLTCEELVWNADGKLLTDAPSTYKIPTIGDVPDDFRVALYQREQAPSTDVIYGSKAVGEPPLMLAIAVREAIREAVAAFANGNAKRVELASPATPEAVFSAIGAVRKP